MASSSTFSDTHTPVRSISLPSRIHPTSVKLESALNHLKTLQTSLLSVNFSADTIQNGLAGLAELYNCIEEEFIHSPQTQQALLRNGKIADENLDESVTLLDTCSSASDLMLTMKQHAQTLQSALRRRGGEYSSIETHISAYISFKKKMKKEIAKNLCALKKLESKLSSSSSTFSVFDLDYNLSFTIKVLQETTEITISIFKSLLLYLSMQTMKPKSAGGWSLISKLMKMKLLSSDKGVDHQKIINEVETVDLALLNLHGNSRISGSNSKSEEVQIAQKMLENLEVSIEGIETGLDSMFRCLVKNRVSFLNILTSN
ncbi:DUF241 domain protein [Melia azedarach]|uniref:DUF241 domain protein n=1 Tax=Melia azedarach TaxID=155640 RepID=A0ACC1XTP6_MELAZ|nr:DUF241 domain protein [Melia azedarach]